MGSKQFWNFVSRSLAVVAFTVILVNGVWAANTEKVLYTFTGGNDGGNPAAQLTFDTSGNAYGTTVVGGISGFGTVFKLTPHSNGNWTETVLHDFSGGSDGKAPHGGVTLDAKGNLYGTAVAGGSSICTGDGCGTVFKLTHSGSHFNFSVLYSFTGGTDGFGPGGGVVFDKKGNLYGTTPDGGTVSGCNGQGCGVVYELSPAKGGQWKEKVIHRFTNRSDGSRGSLGLLLVDKGNLYGVAELGGAHGAGTAFKLSPVSGGKWKISTLDGFKGTPHAGFPYGGLISDASGNLYGTTYFGGANGAGSVFKLTNSNGQFKERVLYSFKNDGSDGNSPTTTLVFDAHGNLYGTTSMGGDANNDGTVFKLTPTSGGKWKESVVHRFKNTPDGSNPYYGLTLQKGSFYGTTAAGGASSQQGVIFKLTP